jgi:citrate lyase subunit beta / citryl-CoA lyase
MTHEEPPAQLRRSCLLVPARDPGRLKGAGRFPADELVLDLAGLGRADKDTAREAIIETLSTQAYGEQIVSVRINPIDSMWAYRDVIDVVERVGDFVDCITIPGVRSPGDVEFVDKLLRMIEERIDLAHHIGIAAQIDNAQGLTLVDEVAIAADRLEALIFDAGGMAESLGSARTIDADDRGMLHAVRMTVLVAARTAGLQAVDVYGADVTGDAYRAAAEHSRLLGFDGAWCDHPDQVAQANEVFWAM